MVLTHHNAHPTPSNSPCSPSLPFQVPNIHLDPRRVHQVLPLVTASSPSPLAQQDPRSRGQEATSRDPRLAQEQRVPGGEASRDPRLNAEVSRDPRLTTHSAEPSKASRDPRLAGKDPKEKKDKEREREKDKDKEKEKEKDRKEKDDKKKEKDHHRSSSKKDFVSSLSPSFSSMSSASRDSKKKKKESSKSSKSPSSSSKSSHHVKNPIYAPTTIITATTAVTAATTTVLTVSSTASTSPSPSSSSSSSKDSKKSSSTPEASEGPATFKSDRRSRHRTYKKRDESPDETPEPQNNKRSRLEVTSDSDSDHYDANRPSPALYNKPGEYEGWAGWAGVKGLLAGPFFTSCSHSCLRPRPALPSVCLSAFWASVWRVYLLLHILNVPVHVPLFAISGTVILVSITYYYYNYYYYYYYFDITVLLFLKYIFLLAKCFLWMYIQLRDWVRESLIFLLHQSLCL